MRPPTLLNTCALSQTCLPLSYPSNQLWISTSGMRGTSMMTGLQLVLLCLTTLNCEQLQMAFSRPTMLDWRTYVKYMSSPTPQMHSVSPWTCLIIQDNTCPSPFVRCWCPGSNTTQIILSTSTTSLMVWIWKTISLCTSSPP
jgi:ribosomal protein S27E